MKHTKRLLVLLIVAVLFAGCDKAEPAALETTVVVTEETIVPTEAIETTMPAVDVNEALSNVWDIMDNACVEEIPILPGLLLDDIEDWMETTEFTEIKLYQRTYWNTVRLGVYEDVAVAQISMLEGDNFTGEDLVWNVRMEKADKLENKTAIIIPEDAVSGEFDVLGKGDVRIPAKYYNWVISGSADDTSKPAVLAYMYQVYFEDTQNLYTIYTDDYVFTWDGDSWESNSDRSPTVVLNHIQADGKDYYTYINGDEVKAGVHDVRNFRIKMVGEKKTYQYEFGMTMEQWVNSKYNTDGWKYDSKDPYIVTSADGRYKLNKADYCWREMTAELYGSIPQS